MVKRKVYLGICNPEDDKARVLKQWVISDEDSLMDAQGEMADLVDNDFFEQQDREIEGV